MTIVERLQRAIDDEPFMLGGEHDLLRDALNEIEIQRGIIERLRADLATQQGCCDGAAAQDAHVRREREEHRAEVARLRDENKTLRRTLGGIQVTGPDADGIAWLKIAPRETTWSGIFSLGNGKSMAGQVALLFEELRCEALKEDGR